MDTHHFTEEGGEAAVVEGVAEMVMEEREEEEDEEAVDMEVELLLLLLLLFPFLLIHRFFIFLLLPFLHHPG